MDDMDEIVQEFLVESYENLDQLDRDLVALEQQPESRELLASVFRTIHTIKGTSGFLAFGRLEAVAHVGENLLARLRDGLIVMTPLTTDVLLRMVDTIRALLDRIGDRWTVLILLALDRGTLRFGELHRSINGVTPKVLTQTLRLLERDGLVTRTVHEGPPVAVVYELTASGHALAPALAELTDWARENLPEAGCPRAG